MNEKYLKTKEGSIEDTVKLMQNKVLESDYQDKFKKALDKEGKPLGHMTGAEKKAFFGKVDKMHTAKNEEKDIPKGSHKMPDGTIMKDSEHKKEVKEVFISNINEKYGVNVQNLQDPASFKSLANTQVVIFEALSRLAPKGSVLKNVLSETAQTLKGKHGVECIDVNDFLLEMFVSAGYEAVIEEGSPSKVDFKRITGKLSDIKNIVTDIQGQIHEKDADYESDESLEDVAEATAAGPTPVKTNDKDIEKEASHNAAIAAAEVESEEDTAQEIADQEEAQKPSDNKVPKTEKEAIDDLSEFDKVIDDLVKDLG
jgi:hypothetical protein